MVTEYKPPSILRNVSPSVIQDLTNFSRLKFLGVSDPIDGFAGRTVVQATVRRCHSLLQLKIFSVKMVFGLFWLRVVTLYPPWEHSFSNED